jgi:hypothetical protein
MLGNNGGTAANSYFNNHKDLSWHHPQTTNSSLFSSNNIMTTCFGDNDSIDYKINKLIVATNQH